jgi:NIPSNAP
MMKSVGLALAGVVLACSAGMAVAEDTDATVYELRTYTTHPGRLPALHKRFRDHTMSLFKKHGITNVMYWTPVDKEDTLIYVIKHDSPEAAKKSWEGFRNDPEWKKVAKESEADGKIVMKVESVYMKPTDYSPGASKK